MRTYEHPCICICICWRGYKAFNWNAKKNHRWRFCFDCFFFFISLALSVAALSHSQFCLDFGCYFKKFADSDDVSFVCRCLLNMCHLSFTFVMMTSDDIFPFFSASLTSSRIAVTYSRHTRSLFHFFFSYYYDSIWSLWFHIQSHNKLVHLFSVPCICSPTVHTPDFSHYLNTKLMSLANFSYKHLCNRYHKHYTFYTR